MCSGSGAGFWWVDPAAATLVSLDILEEGVTNIRVAVGDLIERRPMKTDRSAPEPLPELLKARIEKLDRVESAEVRLREVGHVFFSEAFVTPRDPVYDLPRKIRDAVAEVRAINRRLRDLTITLVERKTQ